MAKKVELREEVKVVKNLDANWIITWGQNKLDFSTFDKSIEINDFCFSGSPIPPNFLWAVSNAFGEAAELIEARLNNE